MAKGEGSVYPQRLIRDLRTILGKSRPIRHQSGRSAFWALISDKDDPSSAHFSHPDIGMEMDRAEGYPYPRLGSGNGDPLILNGWPAIYGRPSGDRGQSAANPGDPRSGP